MKSYVVITVVVTMFIFVGIIRADEECGCNAAPAACGAVCEPTCINPHPKICPQWCMPNGCRCNKGYVRDGNTGKCVRYNRCTKKPTTDS